MRWFPKKDFKWVSSNIDTLSFPFPIKNFNGLERLKQLEHLDLENNKLYSFNGFPYLPSLKKLYVLHNPIRSFKDLPNLENLEELYIVNSNISSFKDFPYFPKLKILYLESNRITSFQHLPNLLYLEGLYLENNNIRSFEFLPNLPKLVKLNLESNQITSFEHFPKLCNLESLNVNNNQIQSFRYFPNFIDSSNDKLNAISYDKSSDTEIKLNIIKKIRIDNNPIISYKGISLENFKNTQVYIKFLNRYADKSIEKLISKDLEEHKEAIIKNTNEIDVFAAKLFITYCSNCNLDAFLFAIKNDLDLLSNETFIFENQRFIESICLKYDNYISKEILEYIKKVSKSHIENGDTIYF